MTAQTKPQALSAQPPRRDEERHKHDEEARIGKRESRMIPALPFLAPLQFNHKTTEPMSTENNKHTNKTFRKLSWLLGFTRQERGLLSISYYFCVFCAFL